VLTRYGFTMASKGILPGALSSISAKHRAPSRSSLTVSVVTSVLVLAMVLAGLDPVAEVYTWLSGASTLGIMVLMALSSLAVLVFFRSRPEARTNVWTNTIAPAVALVCLTAVTYLVIKNFDALVPSPVVANVLLVVLAAAFVVGAVVALFLRSRKPAAYAALDA
jgi:amino acid transporter